MTTAEKTRILLDYIFGYICLLNFFDKMAEHGKEILNKAKELQHAKI